MPKLNPYLNFNGNTEEAFEFYRSVFGGEFSGLLRFKEMPGCDPGYDLSEADGEKIMHVSLPIGGDVLMGTDALESMGQNATFGTGNSIAIGTDTKDEAERLFAGLSEGGEVELPLQEMFWGDHFGCFADKFGVRWMITCPINGQQ